MTRLSLSRRKKLLVTLNTLVIILQIILVVCVAGYAYASLYYEKRLNNPRSREGKKAPKCEKLIRHQINYAFKSELLLNL